MITARRNITADLIDFADEFGQQLRSVEVAAAGDGVGAAEGRVLRALSLRSSTSSALARELGMDTGQFARLIKSLVTKGLIERGSGVKQRGRALTLTPAGNRRANALKARQREIAIATFQNDRHFLSRFVSSAKSLGEQSYHLASLQPLIREAAAGETGALLQIATASFVNDFYGFDRSFMAHLHRAFADLLASDHAVLVAEHQRHLAGGLAMLIDRSAGTGSIPLFAMFNSHQGFGWGGLLLDAAVQKARQAKVERLTVEIALHPDMGSYFGKLPAWTRESSRIATFCGAKVRRETWATEVS